MARSSESAWTCGRKKHQPVRRKVFGCLTNPIVRFIWPIDWEDREWVGKPIQWHCSTQFCTTLVRNWRLWLPPNCTKLRWCPDFSQYTRCGGVQMRKSPTSAELKFPAESELRGSAGHTILLTLGLLIISELPYALHKFCFSEIAFCYISIFAAHSCSSKLWHSGRLASWHAQAVQFLIHQLSKRCYSDSTADLTNIHGTYSRWNFWSKACHS